MDQPKRKVTLAISVPTWREITVTTIKSLLDRVKGAAPPNVVRKLKETLASAK